MTESRDFKRLVRERMAKTGESYTVARANFDVEDEPPSRKPADADAPMSVASFKRKYLSRRRLKDLSSHLEAFYGIRVVQMTKLDLGVYRVDRSGGSSWVARVFSAARSMNAVNGDADVLAYLRDKNFPAERPVEEPISVLAGQPVLVTEWAEGSNRRYDTTDATTRALGSMLGRLQTLDDGPPACTRSAGSWHHLSANGGSRRQDIEVIVALLDDAETRLANDERSNMRILRAELEALDDFADLPTGLIHPDLAGANLVAPDEAEGVLVDWAGAGTAPRLMSLATLLGQVDSLAQVDAAVAGYREHASLNDRELERLEAALVQFPMILDCWTLLFQGESVGMVVQRLNMHRQRAAAIAARAKEAFAAPSTRKAVETESEQERLF